MAVLRLGWDSLEGSGAEGRSRPSVATVMHLQPRYALHRGSPSLQRQRTRAQVTVVDNETGVPAQSGGPASGHATMPEQQSTVRREEHA